MMIIFLTTAAIGCVPSPEPSPAPAAPVADATIQASVEPTSTIGLTPAPTPTQTPSSTQPGICPSPLESAYLADIARIAVRLSSVSSYFAGLNERAGRDVSLIEDDDWKREINAVLELMTEQAHGIRTLDAPTTLRSIHRDFSEMALAIQSFAALYADGIDQGDAMVIQAALFHLTEVDRRSSAATQQMEILCQEDGRGKRG